jgi:4-hydroxysphinganine ceramide fatty acyl 2-hydroxylase
MPEKIIWLLGGLLYWTIFEYILHRFVMHLDVSFMDKLPLLPEVWTLHFILHGMHHAFPQDLYLGHTPVFL